MEPWDAFRLPPHDLFTSLREEMSKGILSRGRLDVENLRSSGEVNWTADAKKPVQVEYHDYSLVGVKVPSYWQFLDKLPETRFLVCVRDPVEVVTSFARQSGTLHRGLEYELPFNRAINDRLRREYKTEESRRIGLWDLIAEGIIPHVDRPQVHLVRYEDWEVRPAALLGEVASFLGISSPKLQLAPRTPGRRPTAEERERILRTSRNAHLLGYE
jgi:hypothetical protein